MRKRFRRLRELGPGKHAVMYRGVLFSLDRQAKSFEICEGTYIGRTTVAEPDGRHPDLAVGFGRFVRFEWGAWSCLQCSFESGVLSIMIGHLWLSAFY